MPRQPEPSKYPSMIGLGNFAHVARLGHSLASSAGDMIRTQGDGSEQPPNLDMYPVQSSAQAWMDDPSKAPYINAEIYTFSPETLKEFGLDQQDNAPAGGMKRPEMESCANCGTNTPKGSGSCADCK